MSVTTICEIELTEEQREELEEIEGRILIENNKGEKGVAIAQLHPESNKLRVYFYPNDMAKKLVAYAEELWHEMVTK